MIKKKLNILLLLSLVLLFLNLLGTTSLAFEPTKEELKNFFYNYAYYYYGNNIDAETNAINLVNNLDESKLDEWLGYISRYQGRYVLSANNGKIYYWCYTGTEVNLNNHKPYYLNGYDTTKISVNNNYISSWIWTYTLNNNTFSNYTTSSSINITLITNTNASLRTLWFYTDTNVWNANYNSIVLASGYMTPNGLFDGPITDDRFTYTMSELDPETEEIYLNNTFWPSETAQSILFVYNPFSGDEINDAGAVIPGYLFDADQYDYTIFSRWEYNYATKTYEYSGKTWEKTNIGPVHDNLIWVTFEAKDYGTLYKPDSIITAEFVPVDTETFDNVHAFFYIRSPYTNITNGVLNVDNTFSGDYSLIINDNNNTDKIINNNNEKDDFWKRTYDGLFTLESGDISDLNEELKTMLNTEELSGIEDEVNFFEGFQNAEPGDLRISWNPILYDNMKIIPSGDINFSGLVRDIPALGEVMRVTRILIIGALAWLGIKEVWRTICILLGIGFEIYDDHEEENEIVVSQHETWNYNTGQATVSTTKRQGRNSVTVTGKAPLRKRIE